MGKSVHLVSYKSSGRIHCFLLHTMLVYTHNVQDSVWNRSVELSRHLCRRKVHQKDIPSGSLTRRTLVLGLMTRQPAAEASLVSRARVHSLSLSHLHLTRRGLSPCLHTRYKEEFLQPPVAGQSYLCNGNNTTVTSH